MPNQSLKKADKLYQEALEAALARRLHALVKYLTLAIEEDSNLRDKALHEEKFALYKENPYIKRILFPDDEMEEGVDYMYDNEFEEAVEFFEEYLKDHPKERQIIIYYLGICYGEMQKYEKALAANDEYLKFDKTFPDAYFNRGTAFEGLKRYEEAKQAYLKAIELEPNYDFAYYNLGSLELYELHNYQHAVDCLSKAIKEHPDFENLARYKRALAYEALHDRKNMIKDLKDAIKKDPEVRNAIKENETFAPYLRDPDFCQLLKHHGKEKKPPEDCTCGLKDILG